MVRLLLHDNMIPSQLLLMGSYSSLTLVECIVISSSRYSKHNLPDKKYCEQGLWKRTNVIKLRSTIQWKLLSITKKGNVGVLSRLSFLIKFSIFYMQHLTFNNNGSLCSSVRLTVLHIISPLLTFCSFSLPISNKL